MGHAVPTISLTLSGNLPQTTEIIRPISIGTGSCNFDDWMTKTGDSYSQVSDIESDGDSSYIYICGQLATNNSFLDMFEMSDVSLPVGSVVDYVKITAIVKNLIHWEWTDDGTGVPYGNVVDTDGYTTFWLSTDDCSTITSSPSLPLQYPNRNPYYQDMFETETDWYGHNYISTLCPSTGLPWTESDINSLNIGISTRTHSSYGYYASEFPMEICTASSRWLKSAGGTNSVTVIQDDDDATYMMYPQDNSDPTGNNLLYTINDDSDGDWDSQQAKCNLTYVGIEICARACKSGSGASTKFKIVIKNNGNYYYSPEYTRTSSSYTNSCWTLTERPWDSQPWEQEDFDPANTEFGVVVTERASDAYLRLSEYKLSFTTYFSTSEVRCTQLFATIVYSEEPPCPCLLPKPVDILVDQDLETMGLNFWSGNREVYGLGRSSKRTTLSGLMWDGCTDSVTTCEDLIECIRSLAKRQQPISIDGLRYDDLNTDYNITAFSWRQVCECPNNYEWRLELEFTDSTCTI